MMLQSFQSAQTSRNHFGTLHIRSPNQLQVEEWSIFLVVLSPTPRFEPGSAAYKADDIPMCHLARHINILGFHNSYIEENLLHFTLYISNDRLTQFKGILLLITRSLLAKQLAPTLKALFLNVINFVWRPVKIWLKFNRVNSKGLYSELYNLYWRNISSQIFDQKWIITNFRLHTLYIYYSIQWVGLIHI